MFSRTGDDTRARCCSRCASCRGCVLLAAPHLVAVRRAFLNSHACAGLLAAFQWLYWRLGGGLAAWACSATPAYERMATSAWQRLCYNRVLIGQRRISAIRRWRARATVASARRARIAISAAAITHAAPPRARNLRRCALQHSVAHACLIVPQRRRRRRLALTPARVCNLARYNAWRRYCLYSIAPVPCQQRAALSFARR